MFEHKALNDSEIRRSVSDRSPQKKRYYSGLKGVMMTRSPIELFDKNPLIPYYISITPVPKEPKQPAEKIFTRERPKFSATTVKCGNIYTEYCN